MPPFHFASPPLHKCRPPPIHRPSRSSSVPSTWSSICARSPSRPLGPPSAPGRRSAPVIAAGAASAPQLPPARPVSRPAERRVTARLNCDLPGTAGGVTVWPAERKIVRQSGTGWSSVDSAPSGPQPGFIWPLDAVCQFSFREFVSIFIWIWEPLPRG